MSSPNAFIGDPLLCYWEGDARVSISWLSLEELIYLYEMKEKQEEILGYNRYKDNQKSEKKDN
jgi:hypothetical protein